MTSVATAPEIRHVKKSTPPRVTAESMAARQRDISVSEFFAKNRHLLGFDNPRKALLTTVKEAVDNSLDACEEAGILPDITVVIEDLEDSSKPAKQQSAKDESKEGKKSKAAQTGRYRVTVVDNGPGIVKKQVEHIFGRLLYGSKFHRLKMSRGQQGIGISAAGMYGLITTGRPMMIQSRPSAHKPAHHIELVMNTKTNRAEVTLDEETDDFPLGRLRDLTSGTRELAGQGLLLSPKDYPTGTSVSIELEGRYQKGRGSVDEFLELTAIANPHARITFVPPAKESAAEEDDVPLLKKGAKPAFGVAPTAEPEAAPTPAIAQPAVTTETNGVLLFPRAVNELPPETKEIQPHPKGIELGILLQMLKEAQSERETYTLYNFLQDKFSRVSSASAASFCDAIGVTSRTKISDLDHDQSEKLFKVLQDSKLPPPPTDCLAPIGVRQLLAGLLKGVRAEFYAASSREAEVYRGRPFQIEAALAFGGELPADDSARVIRFANRVPLLFQQSACSSFKSVIETNWRNYDLQHPRNALPIGALVVMIHMASVWVPFTSESKEAIADYDEIRKEMKLALMECGRKLGTYLRKRAKMRREGERRDVFERYIGEIAKAASAITGADAKKFYDALLAQAKKKTAIADLQLDEDGRRLKEEEAADEEGVIIISQSNDLAAPTKGGNDMPPMKLSKAEAAALKVAAMQNEDDQPNLIETEPAKRLSQKGKTPARATAKATDQAQGSRTSKQPEGLRGSSRGSIAARPPVRAGKEPPTPKGSSKPNPSQPDSKKPKPRMRLVNGKMVPLDEGPGLF